MHRRRSRKTRNSKIAGGGSGGAGASGSDGADAATALINKELYEQFRDAVLDKKRYEESVLIAYKFDPFNLEKIVKEKLHGHPESIMHLANFADNKRFIDFFNKDLELIKSSRLEPIFFSRGEADSKTYLPLHPGLSEGGAFRNYRAYS